MKLRISPTLALAALGALAASQAPAAPKVTRLTPPSELFRSGKNNPVIARFLPGQRFDLQATISPDSGATIDANSVRFLIDGQWVTTGVASTTTSGLVAGLPAGTLVASVRGYSQHRAGVHKLTVQARQSDGQTTQAHGNFEVEDIQLGGRRIENIIIMFGDGMGASHRTAARIMARGYAQGKAKGALAMDTFPYTGMVMTASLNSIVTDSAPGMASYVTGNKHDNNQEGVFPDDTMDAFDNPRTEYLGQYLHRKLGKSLGIVTTADVFDATPAANAVYTANRGAGTGIVDQFFDERNATGLRVLMGGGRKWFLPAGTPGSQRSASNDYVLPADVAAGWGAAPGASDPARNLIGAFQAAGWSYASDAASLNAASDNQPLLGLFAYSNMNVALDKINGRRGASTVVNDYGFPNQPMLDEMTDKALDVLARDRDGFVLMVEAASIDKQAHNMDSERWMLDTLEFDRAIAVAQRFAERNPGTLVLIAADHECSGAAIIGASTVTTASLQQRAASGGGAAQLRNGVVGLYETAGFPNYIIGSDGYPVSTDIDRKLLIGYGANADRYEDWLTNPLPLRDSQQPFNGSAPLNTYPPGPLNRDVAGNFLITGQVEGTSAAHTATDIPLSAMGRGARLFTGVMDNSDVFFKLGQLALGGDRPFAGRWARYFRDED